MPNPPLVGFSSFSQQMTQPREWSLASRTANAVIVNGAATARYPTSTHPATSTANGVVVFPSEGTNYIKLCPVIERSTGSNTWSTASMRVVGWNFDAANALWIPTILADFDISPGTNYFSLSSIGATPTFSQAYTMVLNGGDAKNYNASSTGVQSGTFSCVDTWGCSIIELEFRGTVTAGSPVANCWYASA